jgi:hypothetical protein
VTSNAQGNYIMDVNVVMMCLIKQGFTHQYLDGFGRFDFGKHQCGTEPPNCGIPTYLAQLPLAACSVAVNPTSEFKRLDDHCLGNFHVYSLTVDSDYVLDGAGVRTLISGWVCRTFIAGQVPTVPSSPKRN